MADDEVPARPRRERPLRAPGREEPANEPAAPPAPPEPPTVTTPPVGPPVVEFVSPQAEPERDDHVVVTFDGPTTQRRWTVALRLILAIPHFFWLELVTIAAGAVGVIAWFAALFTARVPEGMANFLSDVVQYQARVYAYSYMLLTDQYPPFALANSDYAVSVATHPGQLNRAAVFFRPILLVPAGIMTFLVGVGMQIAMIVGWIITLILGRLPTPLWEANAAVLRYATRFQAFAFMLTAEQPKALWGDPPAPAAAAAALGEPDLPERPRITRLVLSKAARRLLVTFIVLTIVVYGGLIVVGGVTGVKTARAYQKLDDSHHTLGVAVNQFGADAQQCAISGGLTCLHDANNRLANAFDGFATEVGNISFPAQLDASPLIADAHDCSSALRRMAVASTQADYGAAAADYQSALNRFNQDYSDFAYNADNTN